MAATRAQTANRWLLALLAGAVGLCLLWLAVPRFQASMLYLPVDTAIKNYYRSGDIPDAQLAALTARAQQAHDVHAHYRYLDGLSFLHYLQAVSPETRPWLRRPALHKAMDAALASVESTPAKPRTWLRIATVRAALGQPEPYVISALKMSMLTGRVEPTLLLPRLELTYRYLEQLDTESVNLLRDQTLLAWRVNERAVRRSLAEGRLDIRSIKSVLGDRNPAIVQDMEGPA